MINLYSGGIRNRREKYTKPQTYTRRCQVTNNFNKIIVIISLKLSLFRIYLSYRSVNWTEKDRNRQIKIEKDRERQKKIEKDRVRQRKTEKDRKRQKKIEKERKDSKTQKKTEKDR